MDRLIATLDPDRHVLIAGPTASGKSALALRIAEAQGGTVVNADALQVWSCWRLLTARPDPADEARAPHVLYGHVAPGRAYSVGAWLSEIAALPGRLIAIGGTGLYMNALTRGLAVIPPTPPEIRARADALNRSPEGLARMIAELDQPTRARIDLRNPVRVQRAWEVLTTTGRGISDWQADTPPPLMPAARAHRLVLQADRDVLAQRIDRRFRQMIAQGALEEVRAMLPQWDPAALWAKAIGAPELVAHLLGQCGLDEAIEQAIIATRQYAKAQRSFFRGRLADWDSCAV